MLYEFAYFPLGDHRVVHVEPAVLPLYWTVLVQCITQPVVRLTSTIRQNKLTFKKMSRTEKCQIDHTIKQALK